MQLASATSVLAVLHPLLLAVLLLSIAPRGLGGLFSARISYKVHNRTVAARNARGMMHWWLTTPNFADEVRANTMRPYLYFWYRTVCDRVEGCELPAVPEFLRVNLLASLSGICVVGMWASLGALVLAGRFASVSTAIVTSQTAGAQSATSRPGSLWLIFHFQAVQRPI
ncbi:hypothetical protein [Streptomyces smyrnaeus]|uniref:hypothetical protein n=1 Tax=Streptomyces smyrnaeus TaxID=1387713 RepID=UPI003686CFA9